MIAIPSRKQRIIHFLHHLWSICLLGFAVVIVLAAVFFSLVRAATPLIANHRQDIEAWLSHLIRRPITMSSIQAGWRGFEPVITIQDATLYSTVVQGEPLIKIKSFNIGFNIWRSLLSKHFHIGLIGIAGAHLEIQETDNEIIVHAKNTTEPLAVFDKHSGGQDHLLRSLLSVSKIYLDNFSINWQREDGSMIPVHKASLEMLRDADRYHIWGAAALVQGQAINTAFIAELRGDLQNINSVQGKVFVQTADLDFTPWLAKYRYKNLRVASGRVSSRVWLNLSKGHIQDIQSQTDLQDAALISALNQNRMIFPRVSAQIYWQRSGQGWALTLDKLKLDYAGEQLQPETLYLAEENQRYQFFIRHLPIAVAIRFAKTGDMLQNQASAALLAKLAPSGVLDNVYAQFQDADHYALQGTVNNLVFQATEQIPGLQQFNGAFTVFPDEGELSLDNSGGAVITMPRIEKNPLSLQSLTGNIRWYRRDDGWLVWTHNLSLANPDMTADLRADVFLPKGAMSNPYLNIFLRLNNFQLKKVAYYLPKIIDKHQHLSDWLNHAFIAGYAPQTTVAIRGYAEDFPYNDPQLGLFAVDAQLQDVTLNYHADWPWLKHVAGNLKFIGTRMEATLDKGEIFNNQIQTTQAVIPDIAADDVPELTISGKLTGTLSDGLNFLEKSPLYDDVGKHLANLHIEGPMQVHLNLDIPLDHADYSVKVRGAVSTSNAALRIPDWKVSLNNLAGTLEFGNHSLFARDIKARFLQSPVNLNVTTLGGQHPITQFEMQGMVDTVALRNSYAIPLLEKISGNTHYRAILQLQDHGANTLSISSDLKGITVPYPAPFAKTALQPLPTAVSMYFQTQGPATVRAQFGNSVKAALNLLKSRDGLKFIGGNLHLGQGPALFQKLPGLYIDGSVPQFIWQDWQPLLISDPRHKNYDSLLSMFRSVELKIGKLYFYQQRFVRNRIQISRAQGRWTVRFNGPDLAGEIRLPDQAHRSFQGVFSRLYLQKQTQKTEGNAVQMIKPQSLPPLDLSIDDFRCGSMVFGQVKLLTSPIPQGLLINKLQAESDIFNLSAGGAWRDVNGDTQTQLHGTFNVGEIRELLSQLDYPSNLSIQRLTSQFNLQWDAAPFKPQLSTLQGDFHLNTGGGRINDIGQKAEESNNMGRLLTLLSLQSLPRRLSLDFSDLTGAGFNFDAIQGDFHIDQGDLYTKNTEISGVVGNIFVDGYIHLKQKKLDLNLQIIPHVTASLPILATIAGGPIAGAVTWVADKVASPAINRISARFYRITGTWAKPLVTQIKVSP